MNDLISIVLPVYNVEKYLTECVESVIKQTYTNIEIILVDDGSTDNCGIICDDFLKKDKRIKVIHKKNGGLSDARNFGIKNAKGKYICFIDSDDYVMESYVEELYNLIIINNASISMCAFQRIDENNKVFLKRKIKSEVISGRQALLKLNNKNFYPESIVAWNKMYDIKLFENIKYPLGKIHEDEFTTYKLYYQSNKIAITSEILYCYRTVSNSITNSAFREKRLDVLEALEERISFFNQKKEMDLYELSLIQYETVLMIHYINCKLYLKDSEKIQQDILNKYKKNYSEVVKSRFCSVVNKVKFMIALHSPKLYCYIKKIIKGKK